MHINNLSNVVSANNAIAKMEKIAGSKKVVICDDEGRTIYRLGGQKHGGHESDSDFNILAEKLDKIALEGIKKVAEEYKTAVVAFLESQGVSV